MRPLRRYRKLNSGANTDIWGQIQIFDHIITYFVAIRSFFACSIIAKSQCWLFEGKYGANIHLCPHISYFPPNSTSGICAVVSKIICPSTKKTRIIQSLYYAPAGRYINWRLSADRGRWIIRVSKRKHSLSRVVVPATLHTISYGQRSFYQTLVKFRNSKKMYLKLF